MTKEELVENIKSDFKSMSRDTAFMTNKDELSFAIGYIQGIRELQKEGSFPNISDGDLLDLLITIIGETVFNV